MKTKTIVWILLIPLMVWVFVAGTLPVAAAASNGAEVPHDNLSTMSQSGDEQQCAPISSYYTGARPGEGCKPPPDPVPEPPPPPALENEIARPGLISQPPVDPIPEPPPPPALENEIARPGLISQPPVDPVPEPPPPPIFM
jgi:hypothetical protein